MLNTTTGLKSLLLIVLLMNILGQVMLTKKVNQLEYRVTELSKDLDHTTAQCLETAHRVDGLQPKGNAK